MTDQHPLTDAKCREIANNLCFRWQSHVHQDEVLYSEDDMRAAADWQLEQVINWIRCSPWVRSDCPIYDFEDEQDRLHLIAYIKKSMRPHQQQQVNN